MGHLLQAFLVFYLEHLDDPGGKALAEFRPLVALELKDLDARGEHGCP